LRVKLSEINIIIEQRTVVAGCHKERKKMRNMGRMLFILILTGTFFACKKSPTDDCTPESFKFKFQQSMKIDTVRLFPTDPTLEYYSYTLSAGNKTVFNYTHLFRNCPMISDDEGVKTVIFEIPPQSDSFIINDSLEFRSAKCLIHFSCFCAPAAPVFIKQGSIEGTRISTKSWKIKANLQMPWNSQVIVSFDNIFTVQ